MALTTSTAAVNGAYITTASNCATGRIVGADSLAHDYNRGTMYGVPADIWQRMPESERRFYAEKWRHDQMHGYRYSADEYTSEIRRQMDEAPKAMKSLEPAFLTNTKLLLTEN